MRILQVSPYFSPQMGGPALGTYQLSRHLAQRGHQVTVLTTDYALNFARFPAGDFELVALPNLVSGFGFYISPKMIAWTRKHLAGYDILHLRTVRTFQNIVTAHFARLYDVPYILQAHGTLPVIWARQAPKRLFDLLFGRHLLRDASHAIAVSNQEVEQFRQFGIPEEKISLLPNGLDLDEYASLPLPGEFRQEYGIPDQAQVILYLGRIHAIKGIHHLIGAFAMLARTHPASLLVIAGPDQGEQDNLQQLAVKLGVQGRVLFPGPQYGMQKLAAYSAANVVVYPSAYEIFGMVPLEALLSGKPVIVSRKTGMGELLGAAGAAFLVSFGDEEAMRQAIAEALEDPAAAQRTVTAGQAFIRKNLAWPAITERIEAIYQQVIAKDHIPGWQAR